jgi:integrase/recombinase XerC
MDIYKAFERFISFIEHEENLSSNTVKAYKSDVVSFLEFLNLEGIKEIKDISHLYIRTYVSKLYKNLDKISISRKTSAIRSFLKFLSIEGYLKSDILSRIKSPKKAKKLMFSLSIAEIDKFLSVINKNTDLGKRNFSILELLYATGLRVHEISNLKLADIDFNEKVLKVLGKGRKERIVPFNQEALVSLNKYLELRSNFLKEDKPNDYVYLNKSGSRLGERSIQRLLNLISRKSGILKNATPHTIRHSFATHMLEKGASIKTVKELLGHKSIAATERYTHLSVEELSKIYKKSHPKA